MTRFMLLADDEDITDLIADRLISLTATDEDGHSADTMTVVLDDRDGRLEIPQTGVTLELYLGTPPLLIGRYAVGPRRGMGMPARMEITATAADMTGPLRAPKTRAWADVTLTDIVDTIAAAAGLTPAVSAALGTAHWSLITQTAESDLHFLSRLARELDATVKPAGGSLVVVGRDEGVNAAGVPLEAAALDSADMQSFQWELGERQDYQTVEAEWGDIDAAETRKITVGSGNPVRRLRHVYATAEEASRAASAELAMAQRSRFRLEADLYTFRGDLFAGGEIAVTGLRPELNDTWRLRAVTHRLDGALTTSITAEKAASQGEE